MFLIFIVIIVNNASATTVRLPDINIILRPKKVRQQAFPLIWYSFSIKTLFCYNCLSGQLTPQYRSFWSEEFFTSH
jgi:hypothetical protein